MGMVKQQRLDADLRDTDVLVSLPAGKKLFIAVFSKHPHRLGWKIEEGSPAYSGPARGKVQQGNLPWHPF